MGRKRKNKKQTKIIVSLIALIIVAIASYFNIDIEKYINRL